MSSRVIRGGLVDSEVIAALHDRTFRLYIHLLLSADDYGLVETDFGPIRRSTSLLDWNRELVAKMLGELTDAYLILPYEVAGKRYSAIAKWQSSINCLAPRCPVPSFGMGHVLRPSKFKSEKVREEAGKILSHIKELVPNSATPVTPQRGAGVALVPEGVRGKGINQKLPEPDGSLDAVWDEGVSILCDKGVTESTARKFLGMLCKRYEASDVADAVQAAADKADPKAYIARILQSKPLKGQSKPRTVAL